MRFTLLVMQLHGQITDRREYTHAEVRAGGGRPNFADGCHSLLDEMIPPTQHEVAGFQVPIDPSGRIEMAWRQPGPHAAMATFLIDARPSFSGVFLSGREADRDFIAARVAEWFLEDLPWARAAGSAIHLPPERPLTALTPWPPDAAEADRRRVNLWAVGLSVTFFERAAASG